MSRLLLTITFFLSLNANADIQNISIDSMLRIGHPQTVYNPMLFEVCGRVIADEPVKVTLTPDYNSRRFAPYTLHTDKNGNWCHTIASFNGRIQATAVAIHDDSKTKTTKFNNQTK